MTQDDRELDGSGEQMLEAFFAEARAADPDPVPAALTARLMVDAEATRVRPAAAGGWLARLRAALREIGGAPGLAGVTAAGLAGVWIGFSGPGMTGDLVSQFWQGAASVSGSVSALVDSDPLSLGGDDLLTLMSMNE